MFIECNKCLLNNKDYPQISFDKFGVCDICTINIKRLENVKNNIKENLIENLLLKLRNSKSGKYDCLIGISGGSDSSYIVYLAKKWNLSPLLIHIDGGWNTMEAQNNVKKIVEFSKFDYETIVLDWEQLKDFQYAFIKANVLDIDLPFDNLLLSYLYRTASKHSIRSILFGFNSSGEGILPNNFTHFKNDKLNIIDIHQKFGRNKKHSFKFFGSLDLFWFEKIKKIKFINILDYIEYDKDQAIKILEKELNWENFKGKHNENMFTRFYQDYILIKKFHIHKVKAHLSILICSNAISKNEASEKYLKYLSEKDENLINDIDYFCKKLKLSKDEFTNYINSKPINHTFYKSELNIYNKIRPLYQFLKRTLKLNFFNR